MRLIVLFFICLPILSFSQLTPEEEKEVLRLKDVIDSNAHDTLKFKHLCNGITLFIFQIPFKIQPFYKRLFFGVKRT